MSMTKAEMASVRVAINRLYDGPPMMRETLSTPEAQALLRALQSDLRAWLGREVIAHLQNMLPPNERVKRHE